jgi:hypothetical protein
MSWENINPYRAISLTDQVAMAALKGDINYLHDGNGTTYHHPGTGANYTVSGDLGQDIDSVNMKLQLVTNGGLVMGAFYGQFLCPSVGNTIRVSIIREDPISHVGRNLFYDFDAQIGGFQTPGESRGWLKPFPGLPAGTHEFRMVWGVNPAGTASLLIGYRPRFSVWEWK